MKTHMSRIIALIMFTLVTLTGYSQEKEYVVCVRHTLPVYMFQRTESDKIGEIADQTIIKATPTKEKAWMEIQFNNRTRYIQSRYLVEYTPYNYPYRISRFVTVILNDIDNAIKTSSLRFTSRLPYLFVLILGLILMLGWDLMVFGWKARLNKNHFNLYCTGFIILMLAELYCMLFYKGNVSWFCSPDNVGWILAGICLITFAGITLNQIMVSVQTVWEMDNNTNRRCDYKIGLYSYGAAIIAYIITSLFCKLDYDGLILGGLVLCQIIQMGIILVKHLKRRSFDIELVLSLILYATIAITMPLLFMECLGRVSPIISIILLLYFLKPSGSGCCCRNCRTYNCGYCHYRGDYVNGGSCCNKWEGR